MMDDGGSPAVAKTAPDAAPEEDLRLTEALVAIALGKADYHAGRVARRLGLQPADMDDLRQDLLLAVVRKARSFDIRRAAWSTFVELVIGGAVADRVTRILDDRRTAACSLDAPMRTGDDADAPFGERFADDDGIGAFWQGVADPFKTIDRRIDLARFVQGLPDDLRRICRLLATETPTTAQRLSGLSPAEFYRCLHDLRMRLRAVGQGMGTP